MISSEGHDTAPIDTSSPPVTSPIRIPLPLREKQIAKSRNGQVTLTSPTHLYSVTLAHSTG
jgi:hypothetical protein